jgi:hypothetical protein
LVHNNEEQINKQREYNKKTKKRMN